MGNRDLMSYERYLIGRVRELQSAINTKQTSDTGGAPATHLLLIETKQKLEEVRQNKNAKKR